MYGLFGSQFFSPKSSSHSQCLISVYLASGCLGDRTVWLPFDTQQITIMKVIVGNSGRLHLAFLPVCSPKSVSGCFLPCLQWFLPSQISLAHLFKYSSTHCHQIHSAFSKYSNGSQFSNNAKTAATNLSQRRGPSRSYFKPFCHRISEWCLGSRHPVTHTGFFLLDVQELGWPILFEIAPRSIQFTSGWLGLCLVHHISQMNQCSYYLPHICHRNVSAMGANLHFLQHQLSWVLVVAGMITFGGLGVASQVHRNNILVGSQVVQVEE